MNEKIAESTTYYCPECSYISSTPGTCPKCDVPLKKGKRGMKLRSGGAGRGMGVGRGKGPIGMPAKIAFLQKLANGEENETPESPGEGAQAAPEKEEKPSGDNGAPPASEGSEAVPAASPENMMSVIQFFAQNPNPSDDDFHAFAEQSGVDVHMAEACAYRLATIAAQLLTAGKSKDAGLTYQNVPPEVLQQGMEVEMEHGAGEIIAKKIALDHLAEGMTYYDELAKMEQALEGQKDVVATPAPPQEEAETQDVANGENEKTGAILQKIAEKVSKREARKQERIVKQPGWKETPTGMYERGGEHTVEISETHPTDTLSRREFRRRKDAKEGNGSYRSRSSSGKQSFLSRSFLFGR